MTRLRRVGGEPVLGEHRHRRRQVVRRLGQTPLLHAHQTAVHADAGRGDGIVAQPVDGIAEPAFAIVESSVVGGETAELAEQDGLRVRAESRLGESVLQHLFCRDGAAGALQGDGAGSGDAREQVAVAGQALGPVERALRRREAAVDALRDGALMQLRRVRAHADIMP